MARREPVGVNISHCKMVDVRPGVRSSNDTRKGGLQIVNRGLNESLGMPRRDTITPVSLKCPRPKRQHLSHGGIHPSHLVSGQNPPCHLYIVT